MMLYPSTIFGVSPKLLHFEVLYNHISSATMIRLISPRMGIPRLNISLLLVQPGPLRYRYGIGHYVKKSYATSSGATATFTKPKTSRSNKFYKYFAFGIGIGIGGSALYYTSDKFRHMVLTADRVGVVTVAVVRCFALYKETLGREYLSLIHI